MSDPIPFSVQPGEVWSLDASDTSEPVRYQAVYHNEDGTSRIEEVTDFPYTFTPQEGETHVSWSVVGPDIQGEVFYIDEES